MSKQSAHIVFTDLCITVWTWYCREADIVLLDDGWIQTVKIHQQHIFVIESSFWIQHKSTSVSRFPPSRLSLRSASVHFCFIVVFYAMNWTFTVHFVRYDKSTLSECMKQQIFVALRPSASKRPWQYISTDVGDLSSKRQSIKFTCYTQSVSSVQQCRLQQTQKTARVTEGWSDFLRLIHLTAFLENMWYQLHTKWILQIYINTIIQQHMKIHWSICDTYVCDS